MKVSVIADRDTVNGFALAGIKDLYAVDNREEAKKALAEVMENPDMGVVIITERYALYLTEDIRRWREEKPLYPLIVEIQDKKGKVEKLPLMSKREVADRILDRVAGMLRK